MDEDILAKDYFYAKPRIHSLDKSKCQWENLLPKPYTKIKCESKDIIRRQICEIIQGKTPDVNKVVILCGEAGSGKTELIHEAISVYQSNTNVSNKEILFFEVTRHCTFTSVYDVFSESAKQNGYLKESAHLSSTDDENNKIATLKLIVSKFKLLCVDNIDSDGGDTWEYLRNIISGGNILLGSSSNWKNFYFEDQDCANVIHVPSWTNDDIDFPSKDLHNPLLVSKALNLRGNPLVLNLLLNLSSAHCDVVSPAQIDVIIENWQKSRSLLCNQVLIELVTLIFQSLDASSRHLLYLLSYLRRPFPVKNIDDFNILLQTGLIRTLNESNGLFIMVPQSIQSIVGLLKTEDHLEIKDTGPKYANCVDLWKSLLTNRLKELLNAAGKQSWPYVPEPWQYVDVVTESERYNLRDLINKGNDFANSVKEIEILQECLFHAVLNKDDNQVVALIFLMDRYIYWQGNSKQILSLLDIIHKRNEGIPIAPQLVTRKARVLKDEGDLQGAERLLDEIIENEEQLGSWKYKTDVHYQITKAVSLELKGNIRRGLCLWLDAAKHYVQATTIFRSLNKPDKKGLAAGLSILAVTLQEMSEDDFKKLYEECKLKTSQALLEAIACVTEAAKFTIYTPLYYAKNKRRAGELSLIFAKSLKDSTEKINFLFEAAFELRQGLSCHRSLSRLESREQYYEFIASIFKFSHICKESIVIDTYGKEAGQRFERVANLLYEHYCSFSRQIQHTQWSEMLINTTLKMLGLPKIPQDDEVKMHIAGVPDFQVKEIGREEAFPVKKDVVDFENIDFRFSHNEMPTPAYACSSPEISKGNQQQALLHQLDTAKTSSTQDAFDSRYRTTSTFGTEEGKSLKSHSEEDKEAVIKNLATVFTYLTSGSDTNEVYNLRMNTTMATLEDGVKVEVDFETIEKNFEKHQSRERRTHSAVVWRYDAQSGKWSDSMQTLAFIGEKLDLDGKTKGACRDVYNIQHLHQDDPRARYVAKQYKLEKYKNRPKTKDDYKQDVIFQTTSRYYATMFNQHLYKTGKTFEKVEFLPAVLLELTDIKIESQKFFNVEPYIDADFRKFTNNLNWVEEGNIRGKALLLAFCHFTYCSSKEAIIIVDIQGWTSQDKNGVTFLTDPQIHRKDVKGKAPRIQGKDVFQEFWHSQHPECNDICNLLKLNRPSFT